jgi:pimeloyl-ACP methyl ester carboxylesterase
VLRAVVAFVGSTLVVLTVGAQLAPGWRPAPTEAPLRPTAAPASAPAADPQPTVQIEAEVTGGPEPLAAWVTLPTGTAGPVPGVVLVPGAGPSTRDAMAAEADALGSAGIASIRYDKPTATYGALHRDFAALATDAVHAADVLAGTAGIEADRVGVLGFSEGAWVAPLAVQQAPDRFAFLVLNAASVVTPLQETAYTVDQATTGLPDGVRRVLATMNASGRTVVDYGETDVTPALAGVTVPTLAFYGADDTSIPVNVATRRLLATVPAPLTIEILPDAGHRPPVASGYLSRVAALARTGEVGPGGVVGAEPASALGLAGTPTTSWYHDPVLQTGFSALVALTVGLLPWPRRRRPTSAGRRPAADLVRS